MYRKKSAPWAGKQPQTPTKLRDYWVSRGLVLAILPEWYATPAGCFPLVRTSSPADLPTVKGKVSGFGTTYAGNTNSYLTGPTLNHPKSRWRSLFVLLYAASTGGGGIGRVFQHATGNGADGSGGELLCVDGTGGLRYSKTDIGINYSDYKSPSAIPLNTWVSYGLTHQQIVGDTLPQGYKNGVAETWSASTAPGANDLSSAVNTVLAIGNRPSDVARTWDGMLGIQLYFDGYLSGADHAALNANPWQVFEPIPQYFPVAAGGAPQLLVPISDVSAGAWTPSAGSDLYAMLDESTYSDADYIVSTTPSTCEMRVTVGTDPLSSTGHILRYRLLAGTGTISAYLKQGSTTIASYGPHTLTGSAQDFAQTLTGGEADSITDYSDLRVVFTSTA